MQSLWRKQFFSGGLTHHLNWRGLATFVRYIGLPCYAITLCYGGHPLGYSLCHRAALLWYLLPPARGHWGTLTNCHEVNFIQIHLNEGLNATLLTLLIKLLYWIWRRNIRGKLSKVHGNPFEEKKIPLGPHGGKPLPYEHLLNPQPLRDSCQVWR